MYGRFKVVIPEAGERVSKSTPDVRVNKSYIYFNKLAIELFFDNNYETNLLVGYDEETNEYFISDLGDNVLPHSRPLRNQRYSDTKTCRKIVENIGTRPIIKKADVGQAGLILARRED